MAIVVRAETDDPAALIPAIRRELAAMDSTIPAVFAVYSDVVAASLARHRLGALVLVVFGLVSLTLAAVGTYGLISFSVNQRFNEIAVRSAFGAERDNLLKMFVKRALQLAGIGVVLGVAGAIALRQVVASQLYEISALDPWVLALVPLTMLAVTRSRPTCPRAERRASTFPPRCARTEREAMWRGILVLIVGMTAQTVHSQPASSADIAAAHDRRGARGILPTDCARGIDGDARAARARSGGVTARHGATRAARGHRRTLFRARPLGGGALRG